jgi:hypothetical protein
MMRVAMTKTVTLAVLLALASACGGDDDDGSGDTSSQQNELFTVEQLKNPETCKDCHPKHYREWSASMHAYASEDPVFVAMNKRGQREAQLGEFCVNCHAPMAVSEGKTTDGLNLDELPDHLKGVTCYFCHNAVGVDGDHNNMVKLANDQTMRGSIYDPVDPKVHRAAGSEFHDRASPKSSALCGGCHDIITPDHAETGGVHLERTFAEYKSSVFSHGVGFQSCQSCHMNATDGVAADVKGVGPREVHEHLWAAVDVPLTDFPHREALRAAVEECELRTTVDYVAITPGNDPTQPSYKIELETGAGHSFPSGSAHDRRVWFEFMAYDAEGKLAYEDGKIADDALEVQPEGRPGGDAKNKPLWTFHDRIFGADGTSEVHMFWDAAKTEEYKDGYDNGFALPAATPMAASIGGHTQEHVYLMPRVDNQGELFVPSKVEARLRVRPIGRDVLQDLVDSGDLDASVVDEMPTFTAYSMRLDWPVDGAARDFEKTETSIPDCNRYKCLLDPKSEACGD